MNDATTAEPRGVAVLLATKVHPVPWETWQLGETGTFHSTKGQASMGDEMNAEEAVYALLAWLTTREQSITLSRYHNSAKAARIAKQFCAANCLDDLRDGWEKRFVFPPENKEDEKMSNDGYVSPLQLGIALGELKHENTDSIELIVKYIEFMHSLLDEADGEDAFGTEGWRHRFE
jgi:hypothetical protein